MASVASWVRSFGVSIAIHAMVLAVVYERSAVRAPDPGLHALVPVRIVWEEPAPGPPAAAAVPAPVARVPPPSVPEAVARKEEPVRVKTEVPRRPARRRGPRPVAPQSPAPVPEGASDAGATAATAADASAGSGTRGDGGGGSGTGDAPLALAAVARPPELVERVLPEYPPRARTLELEGQVVLEVVLDREGRPEPEIRVLRSQPPFDAAALAAVRRWRFRPARDAAGRAVRVLMEIPVRFELR